MRLRPMGGRGSRAMKGALVLVTTVAAVCGTSAPAAADSLPEIATDAFYIGVRIDPGSALTMGWDLDVYLDSERAFSIGPRVSLSVLGTTQDDGSTQELLFAADVMALKVGLNEPGGAFRPYLTFGAGFIYFDLPEQSVATTVTTDMGAMVEGMRVLPQEDGFGGLLTMGAGTDIFVQRHWGLTFSLLTHIGLTETDRIPTAWAVLQMGIRFGF